MAEKNAAETNRAQGSCLCGTIQINVAARSDSVGACHCGICRKWSGGPFLSIDCGTAVEFTNRDSITVFQSSEWAERGFCSRCGSHLYYCLKQNNQYSVPAGLFKADKELVLDHQVFIDEKPSYYRFANDTKNMTGAEVFALFGPAE